MIDERTARYVMEARPAFEDLRHVAAQLAGMLVLAASGSKDASPHHPMLETARQMHAVGAEGVRRSAVHVNERSRRHHLHLLEASDALARAFACCDRWPIEVDAVLAPLRAAYEHLQSASKALPGFRMVSFEQACCGIRLTT